jgi:hypothetical protein
MVALRLDLALILFREPIWIKLPLCEYGSVRLHCTSVCSRLIARMYLRNHTTEKLIIEFNPS